MGLFDRKPAPKKQQPRQPQQTHGPVNAVPCPWGCGNKIDFREENEAGLLDPAMQPDFECPNPQCGNMVRVGKVQQILMISVVPSPRNAELKAKRRR